MSEAEQRTGVLLVNLGTPDSPQVSDVRRYLRQFLMDPRVLDINGLGRWLLVNVAILPTRPAQSAAAYRSIWGERSPLLRFGEALTKGVAEALGDRFVVELAMRYQNPSIEAAMAKLEASDVRRIIVLPLFPQYSSAATGSAVEEVFRVASSKWNVPVVDVLGEFFDHSGFVESFVEIGRPIVESFKPDHVLFSYHGLPERHVQKSDLTGEHCLARDGCCDAIIAANRRCYRAQCFATTRGLAAGLQLTPDIHSVSFQSRLGKTPWIKPYTDEVFVDLAKKGVKRLLLFSPAFVADCLETVEELAIRGKDQWVELGGEAFELVPSLNAHPRWVQAVADMVRARA